MRGTASGHGGRVRRAKVAGRSDVRRRTAKGVAADRTGQTGKTLVGAAVLATAAAASTAAAAAVHRRQETQRRGGVGPSHRFGGGRRGAGHGHRGVLGRQEVGRQRGRVADRRRRRAPSRTPAAADVRQARGQNVRDRRPERGRPHVRHVHLFVAQRPVRQITIRPLVSVCRVVIIPI